MACNVSTRRMKFLLTSIGLLLLTSVSMGKARSLRCPEIVQVEIGTDGVIACDIGFKFVNLYWYSGDSFSETPPIVKLEDGATVGGDGFDISTNGSLVVLGTDVSREGIYTIVVFHRNGSYEHSRVSLKTFANPAPYFPLIQRCNGNQSCSLKADYKGSVQCAIYGARPAFEIDLEGNGVTLINATYGNVTDAVTGLTNTSIKAYYKSTECLYLANITCIATGNTKDKIKSTLTFYDDCRPIIPTDAAGKGSAGIAVFITLVIIAIIVVAVVVTIYFIKRRQDYQPVGQNDVEVPKYKTVEDKKNALLKALAEKYRASYFRNTFSEDRRLISIDDVYIDLEFEGKDDGGEAKIYQIEQMLTAPFTTDHKRRLFVSNKMQLTFSSYFAYLWSEQTTKDNILLVFNMLDVSYNNDIFATVKEMLQDQCPLTEDDLMKVIGKFGCHIILDGVEVNHIVGENENGTSSDTVTQGDVDSSSKLTVGNILRDRERKIVPKNIFQWVIIYDRDSVQSSNDDTYEVLLIKELANLSIDGFSKYIDAVVDYYCIPYPHEKKKDVSKAVKEVISQCDLRKKFERAPVMLMQMTHLVTKMCLNKSDTSTVVGISSLLTKSMSLLKMRYRKKHSLQDVDSLKLLEEQIGENAFNQLIGNARVELNDSEDIITFSKSIGLIKQSDSADFILFPAECVKYFLSACFIKDKQMILSRFIDQTIQSEDDANNDGRFQILSFICALQPSHSQQICEKILKKGRMNYFLNCFCEASNADEFHAVIKKYVEKDDFVISVYDHKPYLAKVSCLLKYCNKWEITVSWMKFDRMSQKSSQTTVVRTEIFEMPAVEKITFNRLQLNEEETFLYYIEWVMKQNVKTVSFDDCRLPEFSASVTFSLKDVCSKSSSKVVLKKTETEEDTVHKYELNKEEMKWVLRGTEKINKKTEKDAKGGPHDTENTKLRSIEENTVKTQIKSKTTDEGPGKAPSIKATDNKHSLSQTETTANVTADAHAEANKGNNGQPSQHQNATRPENINVTAGEKKLDKENKGHHPGMTKSEGKKYGVAPGETGVSNKDTNGKKKYK